MEFSDPNRRASLSGLQHERKDILAFLHIIISKISSIIGDIFREDLNYEEHPEDQGLDRDGNR